jgi:ABC transporter substrate binding protein
MSMVQYLQGESACIQHRRQGIPCTADTMSRGARRTERRAIMLVPAPAAQLNSRQPSSTEVRMRLIGLAIALVVSVLALLSTEAQLTEKVYRIGVLGEKSSDPSEARLWQVFRAGLRERGWIENKNVVIESRWAEGNPGRIREFAAELVRLKVDVIVTRGSIYTEGARAATSSLPIVFTIHADPENTGHVASLAKPGANITGLSILMTDLNVKGLEFLNCRSSVTRSSLAAT